MTDFTLSNGKEITFDLTKLSHGQYKGLFDPKESDKKSDATIAGVAGLTVAELDALPHNEYRAFVQAFFKKCREPLADPNSDGAPS
jgi:hypothetical protein